MDKWDEMAELLLEDAAAEMGPDKAAKAAVVVKTVIELARGIEQIGADLDRIATALERRP